MKPTKYTEINEVLNLLSVNLQKILGKKLIALYLTGSLSSGDFDYGSSDIDFLAVLTKELTVKELEAIKKMHDFIGQKVPYWTKRIDRSYIPQNWLNNIERPLKKRPYVNNGTVCLCNYGHEWLLNLYVLSECGITLFGQDPKKLIPPLDIKDVREASKRNLIEEWQTKLKEKDPFIDLGYDSSHLQTYAILTMCRILHRAKKDGVSSKKEASNWVKKTFGKKWRGLIKEAENWKHGIKLDKVEETKAFIKFVIKEIKVT